MRYLSSILLVLSSVFCFNGCEKHLMSADYSLPVVVSPEVKREIVTVKKELSTTGLPEVWNYIPADSREGIFHKLLGENADVYFEKNQKGETFVAFEPESDNLQALAQVRKVGNEDGFILVFAGINCLSHPPMISGVYSFEYGEPISSINLYSQKKEGFLQKFAGYMAGEKIKVDTITGATMICDSLGKEISDISKDLLEIKNNKDLASKLLNTGKKMVDTGMADDRIVVMPEMTGTVVVNDVSAAPLVLKDTCPAPVVVKMEKAINKTPVIEKILKSNTDKVATIEIVLVSLATGIIIGTAATNRRRK